jgi:hypothetical protein
VHVAVLVISQELPQSPRGHRNRVGGGHADGIETLRAALRDKRRLEPCRLARLRFPRRGFFTLCRQSELLDRDGGKLNNITLQPLGLRHHALKIEVGVGS